MTFCVLAENCSVYDRRNQIPGLSFRNPLCEGCRNRSRRELNLLRYDYVDLSQLIARADGHSEVKISRPKPESVPTIDIGVFTLRSAIADVCADAERELRRHLGMPHLSVKVREGYGLSDAVSFLHPRVDDLARMPPKGALWGFQGPQMADADPSPSYLDGAQVLALFSELHRRARRVCGLDPRTVRLPGECPSCSVPSLRRTDDEPDRVWCAACKLQFTHSDYIAAQTMMLGVTPVSEGR
jgi:hypothetical protein